MEMMFAVIGALAISLIVRYSMSNRDRVGVMMIPALGTATGAAIWAVGTWAGLKSTEPWLWLATFACAGAVTWIVNARVTRHRVAVDNDVFGRIARH